MLVELTGALVQHKIKAKRHCGVDSCCLQEGVMDITSKALTKKGRSALVTRL
jgi:hypothetical protein